MRYRAKISNENLVIFHNIISQLQRNSIGDKVAVYLTEDYIRLTVISEDMDSIRCYSELLVESLFTDYTIESKSDNAILFEIGLDNWCRALQSGKHAIQCQFKLTKQEDRPYLSFESKSLDAMSLNVIHDIPIRMLPATEITNYMPPNIPSPDVALELPRTKLIRPMVEKMGKYSKNLLLTVYQKGQLILCAESASTVIKTHYNNLTPRYEGNLTPELSRGNSAVVKIDKRKLSNVLNYGNLSRSGVYIFVTDNDALVVHTTLSPFDIGSITYYVPVVLMEFEDHAIE